MKKPICEICEKEGTQYKVFVGATSRTLVAWQPFFDEEGNFHNHDPNFNATYYTCSNGHSWSEKQ
jgi:hypothetical protein